MGLLGSVNRSDVVSAYHELLGREPESEAAIQGYFGCKDVAHMRHIITQSAEYRQRAGLPHLVRHVGLAAPLPPLPAKVARVGFVGNCQVNGLVALVNAMQNQVEAVGFEVTEANMVALHKQSSADVHWHLLDVIWAHPNEQFAKWLLKQPIQFQARVRPLPTIDTLGFHPDCAYVWKNGVAVDSPIGPYHSALVLWAHRQGFDVQRTLALFRPEVFAHLGYFDYQAAGINHLVNKGRDCAMPMATWLAKWQAGGVWMHTINHPRMHVLADVALHCLGLLGAVGAPGASAVVSDDLARSACWPVYPAVAQALGLKEAGGYHFKCPHRPAAVVPKSEKQKGLFSKASPDTAEPAEVKDTVRYLGLQVFVQQSLAGYANAEPGILVCDRLDSDAFQTLAAALPQWLGRAATAPLVGNPYSGLPDYQFWRRAVEQVEPAQVDPVVSARFRIAPHHKVATAGSCFAQHVARALVANGFNYFVTEAGHHVPAQDRQARNYGVFTARFGNVYTARQLRQLQDMALGRVPQPDNLVWQREDGRWVDGLRPYIEPGGFASVQDATDSRHDMLACSSDMFQGCDVLVFTLGLTEGWQRMADGVVVPIAPGVVAAGAPMHDYGFINFTVDEVLADMRAFLWTLKSVNRKVRVVLTVSPVPLMATFEDRSVVASTVHSKSVLRTVAGMLEAEFDWVGYFASYEVITAGPNASRYFGPDRRSVTEEGVAHVMRLFIQHCAQLPHGAEATPPVAPTHAAIQGDVDRATQAVGCVVCDEEHLDPASR